MSDANANAGAGVPAGGATANAGGAALPAPAQTAASTAATRQEPVGPAVPAALNRKERQVLRKHFGIKIGKDADLAERGAEFREKQDARKARIADYEVKLPAAEARIKHLEALVKAQATSALAALPQAAQDRIKAIAADDAIKTLELCQAAAGLIPAQAATTAAATTQNAAGGAAGAQAAANAGASAGSNAAQGGAAATQGANVTQQQQQGRQPLPGPAQTSAAGQQPAGSQQTNTIDHRAVWEGMRETRPMMASQYLLQHEREIFKDQAAP